MRILLFYFLALTPFVFQTEALDFSSEGILEAHDNFKSIDLFLGIEEPWLRRRFFTFCHNIQSIPLLKSIDPEEIVSSTVDSWIENCRKRDRAKARLVRPYAKILYAYQLAKVWTRYPCTFGNFYSMNSSSSAADLNELLGLTQKYKEFLESPSRLTAWLEKVKTSEVRVLLLDYENHLQAYLPSDLFSEIFGDRRASWNQSQYFPLEVFFTVLEDSTLSPQDKDIWMRIFWSEKRVRGPKGNILPVSLRSLYGVQQALLQIGWPSPGEIYEITEATPPGDKILPIANERLKLILSDSNSQELETIKQKSVAAVEIQIDELVKGKAVSVVSISKWIDLLEAAGLHEIVPNLIAKVFESSIPEQIERDFYIYKLGDLWKRLLELDPAAARSTLFNHRAWLDYAVNATISYTTTSDVFRALFQDPPEEKIPELEESALRVIEKLRKWSILPGVGDFPCEKLSANFRKILSENLSRELTETQKYSSYQRGTLVKLLWVLNLRENTPHYLALLKAQWESAETQGRHDEFPNPGYEALASELQYAANPR
jgi:hypothetical protein